MVIGRNGSVAAIVPWLLVALAAGCATKSTTSGGDATAEKAGEERVAAPPVTEIPPNAGAELSRTSPPMIAELTQRNASGATTSHLQDVLFDFDQHTLRLDSLAAVETNAKLLQEDGAKSVLLEGRADEVGTEDYNMILGERRALGVKRYLETLGLSVTIDTTSYGKDRPLCFEHSLDCWQKNRSVHFVVKE